MREPKILLTEEENKLMYKAFTEGLDYGQDVNVPAMNIIIGKLNFVINTVPYGSDDDTEKTIFIPVLSCLVADSEFGLTGYETAKGIPYVVYSEEPWDDFCPTLEETSKVTLGLIREIIMNDPMLDEAACAGGEYW